MSITPDILSQLFAELGEWFEFEQVEPVEWVVGGGVALGLQDLLRRTTQDVDVLCAWNGAGGTIVPLEGFPPTVQACIERVASNHPDLAALGKRWVNLGAARLAQIGLPRGFESRLVRREFGPRLTLHLLGREDLLALKLYAAADDLGPRQRIHFEDLKALAPTVIELDRAVEWIRSMPDFDRVRSEVKQLLLQLGFHDLAYYV